MNEVIMRPALDAAGLGLTWLAQSTALLILGLIAARLARGRGPALQSAVYRTTLVAVLLCPAASAALAAMGLEGIAVRLPEFAVEPAAPPIAATPVEPPAAPSAPVSTPIRFEEIPVEPEPPASVAAAPSGPATEPVPVAEAGPTPGETPPGPMAKAVAIGLAAWGLGAIVLLARMVVLQARMNRVRAEAEGVESAVQDVCGEIARRLAVAAPPVRRSPFLSSPCLDGLRRPMVLLPDEIDEDLRDTFVHELAHLARRDAWWNLARRLATAVLWFQPLLWTLSRRLESTAEEVCDDFVVAFGADRARYAELLVSMAGRALPPAAPAIVGMVSFRSLLARRVSRILDASRPLSTRAGRRALLGVLAVGLASTAVAGLLNIGERSRPEEAEVEADPGDGMVRGQILDADGRPIPGATVLAWRSAIDPPGLEPNQYIGKGVEVARTAADRDGRIAIRIEAPANDPGLHIAAIAPGHRPSAFTRADVAAGKPVRLVKGDQPIEGRVVDLEGRPAAGVSAEVVTLTVRDDAEPESAGEATYFDTVPFIPAARSDADGRFRIEGMGRETVAVIKLSGPNVATRFIHVKANPAPPPKQAGPDYAGLEDRTLLASRFTATVEPTRPIEGVVRDAETGEPIPGAIVTAAVFRGWMIDGQIYARADDRGRYRLVGLPKEGPEGHRLAVYPPLDRPYFVDGSLKVASSPGMGPSTLDVALRKGIWIEGRATDLATGEPVEATVDYFPMISNIHAKAYPNFVPNRASAAVHQRRLTDADGRFRLPGLPGEGVLAVRIRGKAAYRTGVGAEGLPERTDFKGLLATYDGVPPHLYNAIKALDLPEDAGAASVDVALDPGGVLTLRLVDEAGAPIPGATVRGATPLTIPAAPMNLGDSNEARVVALAPGATRQVLLEHADRGVGAIVLVDGPPPAGEAERTVTLRKFAAVTGRLVDGRGEPVRGRVSLERRPKTDRLTWDILTIDHANLDADGRFRLACPEADTVHVAARGMNDGPMRRGGAPDDFSNFHLADDLKLTAGQVVDLGTFDVETGKRVDEPKPAEKPTVSGRVVDPDGRPIAGAVVVARRGDYGPSQILWSLREVARATSDAEGTFRLPSDAVGAGAVIAARADGFRPAVLPQESLAAGEVVRLAKQSGMPIDGRVVDVEGLPVAGARVEVMQVQIPDPTLRPNYAIPDLAGATTIDASILPPPATTDADGRFRIDGLGRDDVATLKITGPAIATRQATVVLRPILPIPAIPVASSKNGLNGGTTYGATFTLAVEPARPIEGVVRDLESNEPIPGAIVTAMTWAGGLGVADGLISTATGPDGRYRIEGLPKESPRGHMLAVYPPLDRPYFITRDLTAPATPGLAPITFDISLRKTIWIEGRVTNPEDGKPVDALVDYFPMLSNPHARDYRNFKPNVLGIPWQRRHKTDADGRYRVPGLQGSGIVAIRVQGKSGFRTGYGAEAIEKTPNGRGLMVYDRVDTSSFNSVKAVDVPEGAASFACDLQVDAGRTVVLRVVDEAGEAVAGAEVSRTTPPLTSDPKVKTDDLGEARVRGLVAGEKRPIRVVHPTRKIGLIASLDVDATPEGESFVMALKPFGSVTGRVLDGEGRPVSGQARWDVYASQNGANQSLAYKAAVDLDPDGRFRFDDVPPGDVYTLLAVPPNSDTVQGPPPGSFKMFHLARNLKLDGGQAADLGTFNADTGKPAEPARPAADAGVPITGRIVDLEGRPIAGVEVELKSVSMPEGRDLTAWLEAIRSGEWSRKGGGSAPGHKARIATTDGDGRFRFDGLTPEGIANLELRGDSIGFNRIMAATRKMEPVPAPGEHLVYGPASGIVYGSDFTHAAAPGRPVEGVVRDAKTGEPVANAEVRSDRFAGADFVGIKNLSTRTDARGRFRLSGFPVGKNNQVLVVPDDERPFFMRDFTIPIEPGAGPVEVAIDLHTGIWIEGKLTDKETGGPVEGAWMHYRPFLRNTFAQATPEFDKDGNVDGITYQDRYLSKADGSYRLVGLPGPAIVTAITHNLDYMQGSGAEDIPGMDARGFFETYRNPVEPGRLGANVLKAIDPPADATSVHVDLQATRGATVRIRLVDADGRPARGLRLTTIGLVSYGRHDRSPLESPECEVAHLRPDETRTVVFRDEDRKLGKVIRVKKGDDENAPIEVGLEPLASIVGRLLDAEGEPVFAARLHTSFLPSGDYSPHLNELATDKDGRYVVPNLPVGCDYSISFDSGPSLQKAQYAYTESLKVRPGATTDAGDTRFKED